MKFGRWPTWMSMSRELKTGLYKLSMKDNMLSDGKKKSFVVSPVAGNPTANITEQGCHYFPLGDAFFVTIYILAKLSGSAGTTITFTGFPFKSMTDLRDAVNVTCSADCAAGATRLGLANLNADAPGKLTVERSDYNNIPNSGDVRIRGSFFMNVATLYN